MLQAPHIADADEAVMTRMEKRMATSETAARKALETLTTSSRLHRGRGLPPPPPPSTGSWTSTAQIIALSRRNTNVRALALSLDQKRTLTVACEDSLRALHDALAKRGRSRLADAYFHSTSSFTALTD